MTYISPFILYLRPYWRLLQPFTKVNKSLMFRLLFALTPGPHTGNPVRRVAPPECNTCYPVARSGTRQIDIPHSYIYPLYYPHTLTSVGCSYPRPVYTIRYFLLGCFLSSTSFFETLVSICFPGTRYFTRTSTFGQSSELCVLRS